LVFALSKLLWMVAAPGNALVLLLAAGTALLARGARRWGFALVAGATSCLVVLMLLPVGDWLLTPLEDRFPVPASLPDDIAGIIVLGGGVDLDVVAARGNASAANLAAGRIMTAASLARRHPAARILLAGGGAQLAPASPVEADGLAQSLTDMGVAPERIIRERRSRTTFENAVFGHEVAKPRPGERWVLVTSAWHMPRSVGCFRKAGWEVIPYPVDFRTTGHVWASAFTFDQALSLEGDLQLATLAAKEWVGLLAYRMMGRTDALFPGETQRP
jgi:uncharacterized SAM-binding protein YcdF (DUF218 family)